MKRATIQILLLLCRDSHFRGPDITVAHLSALEENIATQFNELRVKAGLRPLTFRQDIRMRMEACSIQLSGPDPRR